MERFKEDFRFSLKGIDFSTLERSGDCIYGLSRKLDLIYFNPAYILFAEENGLIENISAKFPLGTPIIHAIEGEKVREFYTSNYANVLATGNIWYHQYECSSKNEYRLFHQGVYPLKNGEGLLVINTLALNLPMDHLDRKLHQPIEKRYVQTTGMINQCSNCRKTQSAETPDAWHWIPAWVEKMPDKISHSICPICFDYHWKYSRIKYRVPKNKLKGAKA